MLELATTVITDLPQDSTLGQIKVLFAENEAPCPQPLLLQYLVAPNGSFYVNFDALCSAAFHLLVQSESIRNLLAYHAIFYHKARHYGSFLWVPLDEVEGLATSCVKLLDHLVDSKARLESVELHLVSTRFKDLSADAGKLSQLVLNDYQQKCKA